MQNHSVPFSPPDIRQEDIDAVVETLRSGWITTGPKVKTFEKELAAYVGAEAGVGLSSCTAALEVALRLLGIGPGDEVMVPAYTYTASASTIHHVGAKIVFVDNLPGKLQMDPEAIARGLSERTKAIVPVDVAGVMEQYDEIRSILEDHRTLFRPANDRQEALGRVAISADAAHSLGARQKGRFAGAVADLTSFSFHAVKNLTTAEGGALLWRKGLPWDSEDLYKSVQLLTLHGQNKDALTKNKIGGWEYDIELPGYKYNMTDIQAALGLSQLARYESLLARRRALVERYDQALAPLGFASIAHSGADFTSSCHLYITRLPRGGVQERNRFIERMGEMGVACNVHYKPLPMMSAYRALGADIAHYPNAYAFYEREVTLPLNTTLTDEDVDQILSCAQTAAREVLGC